MSRHPVSTGPISPGPVFTLPRAGCPGPRGRAGTHRGVRGPGQRRGVSVSIPSAHRGERVLRRGSGRGATPGRRTPGGLPPPFRAVLRAGPGGHYPSLTRAGDVGGGVQTRPRKGVTKPGAMTTVGVDVSPLTQVPDSTPCLAGRDLPPSSPPVVGCVRDVLTFPGPGKPVGTREDRPPPVLPRPVPFCLSSISFLPYYLRKIVDDHPLEVVN